MTTRIEYRHGSSPAALADLFLRLALLQQENAEVIAALTCRLVETRSLVEASREPAPERLAPYLTHTEPGIACPPFDTPFRDVRSWNGQPMDHAALPRE